MATTNKGSGLPKFRKLKSIPEGVRKGTGMASLIWEQVKDLDEDQSIEVIFSDDVPHQATYIRTCLSSVNKKHDKSFSFRKIEDGKAIIFHNPGKVVRSKGRPKK